MEMLQTVRTNLIMPNQQLISYFYIFLSLIENTVLMLLFTTVLNIKSNIKQKTAYVLINAITVTISRTVIPYPIGTFVNLVIMILSILLIFKTNLVKTLLAIILPFIVTVVLEMISSKIFVLIFRISYETAYTIPIYRIIFMLIMYSLIFLTYFLAKKYRFNITLLDNIDKRNKKTLIIIFVLGIISIGTQLYLTIFYSEILPLTITLLSILSLFSYFFITLYNLTKTNELEIANQDIENLQLYNKTLGILHDNIRAFKHDFNNIVARNWPDLFQLKILTA